MKFICLTTSPGWYSDSKVQAGESAIQNSELFFCLNTNHTNNTMPVTKSIIYKSKDWGKNIYNLRKHRLFLQWLAKFTGY